MSAGVFTCTQCCAASPEACNRPGCPSAHPGLMLPVPPTIRAVFECESEGVVGMQSASVKRVDRHDDGSFTVVIDYWPTKEQLDERWNEGLNYAMATSDEWCKPKGES